MESEWTGSDRVTSNDERFLFKLQSKLPERRSLSEAEWVGSFRVVLEVFVGAVFQHRYLNLTLP
jgi:hypothetical protein